MSLRITPASTHATSTTNTQPSKLTSTTSQTLQPGAPSAPGLPDTLRLSHNTTTTPNTITSTHPLESRLKNWTATQSQLQSQLLRRNFGIALPLRMSMEKMMVSRSDGFRPGVLGPAASVHGDILSGRDADIQWEDIYNGQDGLRGGVNVGGDGAGVGWTEEMERMVGMGRQ